MENEERFGLKTPSRKIQGIATLFVVIAGFEMIGGASMETILLTLATPAVLYVLPKLASLSWRSLMFLDKISDAFVKKK